MHVDILIVSSDPICSPPIKIDIFYYVRFILKSHYHKKIKNISYRPSVMHRNAALSRAQNNGFHLHTLPKGLDHLNEFPYILILTLGDKFIPPHHFQMQCCQ